MLKKRCITWLYAEKLPDGGFRVTRQRSANPTGDVADLGFTGPAPVEIPEPAMSSEAFVEWNKEKMREGYTGQFGNRRPPGVPSVTEEYFLDGPTEGLSLEIGVGLVESPVRHLLVAVRNAGNVPIPALTVDLQTWNEKAPAESTTLLPDGGVAINASASAFQLVPVGEVGKLFAPGGETRFIIPEKFSGPIGPRLTGFIKGIVGNVPPERHRIEVQSHGKPVAVLPGEVYDAMLRKLFGIDQGPQG